MDITVLFLDCIVSTLDMEALVNLPKDGYVMDYNWYIVTSDVYYNHIADEGVHVDADYSYEQYIIGKRREN